MLGLPGHTDMLAREDVVRLITGGQLRENDLVKKLGEPWRAANEVPELVEYFLRPQLKPKDPPKPTTWVPKVTEPPRKETARVPRADPPPAPAKPPMPPPKHEDHPHKTAHDPAPPEPPRKLKFTRPPEPPPAEKKPEPPPPPKAAAPKPEPPKPEPPKPEPPKVEPPKPEPAKTDPPKTEAPKPEPPKPETREVPRKPRKTVPRLEPMTPKYFSPVDLLRSASHAFEPKKLLISALALLPLMVLWSMLQYLRSLVPDMKVEGVIFLFSMASVVFGLAVTFLALAYATRRQLESRPYTVGEVVLYAARNISTALVYPLLALIPSLIALAALWVLGFVRDLGPGAAVTIKVLFFVPMFFALVAVAGVLAYQLASMFVPSAAVVEGEGLVGAFRAAWSNIRHQRGRVVTNWLIVTVAVGVITIVCLGLMEMAVRMPDWIFGVPRDRESLAAYLKWQEFQGFFAVYRGLAYGLGLTLPVSLLSTLGMLSYLALRQPASAPLSGRLDETGGIEYAHGGLSPMEATSPADTRSGTPPPAGDSRPISRSGSDVADDREEQTLA
jgi:hypothetical protein